MITIFNSTVNLKLQNSITTQTDLFNTALERLVSGYRLNTASDGPAGMYVSSRFLAQIRGLENANKNIQASLDVLTLADSSVTEINELMTSIRELVSESCNEYLTPEERTKKQEQINQLFEKVQDIKADTKYNGVSIFTNSMALDKTATYKNNTNIATAAGQVLKTETPESEPTETEPEEPMVTSLSEEYYDDSTEGGIVLMSEDEDYGISTMSLEEDYGISPMSLEDEPLPEESGTDPDPTPEGATEPDPTPEGATEPEPTAEDPPVTTETKVLTAGETSTLEIDGQRYTVQNNTAEENTITYSIDADGVVTFNMSKIVLTADNGQVDKLNIQGNNNIINTSDENDIITVNGNQNTINAGDGDDTITNNGNASIIYAGAGDDNITNNDTNARIYGEDGTDTLENNAVYASGSIGIDNLASTGNLGTAGSINIDAGKVVTAQINGKTYTFENIDTTLQRSVNFSTDVTTGQITIQTGANITVTAAAGQTDNVKFEGAGTFNAGDQNDIIEIGESYSLTVNGGEGDDRITANPPSATNTGTINGDSGNDTIEIVAGGYSVDGGDGLDYLIGDGLTESNIIKVDEDWGTNGAETLAAGDSKTVLINGKVYTITNKSSTSEQEITYSTDTTTDTITLNASNISVTAIDDQDDKLEIIGDYNTIDTTTGQDFVTITGNNNEIDGGEDTDILYLGADTENTKAVNFENTTDGEWGESGSKLFMSNQSVTAIIDGKTYTITNNSEYVQTLDFSLNEATGEITFTGSSFSISAAEGQKDNIIINGSENTLNTGDKEDKITVNSGRDNTINSGTDNDEITINSSGNLIHAGDGNDTITINESEENTVYAENGDDNVIINSTTHSDTLTLSGGNGTDNIKTSASIATHYTEEFEKGTIKFEQNATYDIVLDDKTYSITYKGSDATADLSYEINAKSGMVTFTGNNFSFNSGDDADNIKIVGNNNEIVTRGGNDTITVYGNANKISGNDGSDDISVYGNNNIVYGSAAGETDTGNNTMYIKGNNNEVYGANGDDTTILNGNNNTAYGGDDGFDIVENSGQDNIYSQMDELRGVSTPFKVLVSNDYTEDATYSLDIGVIVPEVRIDVSSYESATEALKSVDELINQLASVQSSIGMNSDILESIMDTNLTQITNYTNANSTIRDADTAIEYNNLLAHAAMVDSITLLQSQITQNQSNILAQLIGGISG